MDMLGKEILATLGIPSTGVSSVTLEMSASVSTVLKIERFIKDTERSAIRDLVEKYTICKTEVAGNG